MGRAAAKLDDYRAGVPEHYDPAQGVKTIAVASAAEEHFRRAKDATQLYEAIEIKLGEQRRFVLWWDAAKHDGEPKAGRPMSQTDDIRLDSFGLDRDTVSRWRLRLGNERKFEAALEAAKERCRRVCEAEKGSTAQKGASGTGLNEWYTPPLYLEAARRVLGAFDLDPASSEAAQAVVQAGAYFTQEQDGLTRPWHGRVWLNPPFAQPHIENFVTKMVEERASGRVTAAIMLTHNYTDTKWFQAGAKACDAVCFTRGRVRFLSAEGEEASPTQGQAFFYFGDDPEAFAAVFGEHGFIAEVWDA